jgi:hypothetical protein
MHGERAYRHRVGDRAQHRARLGWRADADGVAERDFVAAECVDAFGDAHHVAQVDVTLIRAAEHGRDIATHLDAVVVRAFEDGREAFDRFVDAGVDVPAVERL